MALEGVSERTIVQFSSQWCSQPLGLKLIRAMTGLG
jgi:hypothetical protein